MISIVKSFCHTFTNKAKLDSKVRISLKRTNFNTCKFFSVTEKIIISNLQDNNSVFQNMSPLSITLQSKLNSF